MARFSSLFRFVGLLICLNSFGIASRAQRPPQTMVYDSVGRPIRANHEIELWFAPAVVNRAAFSSRTGNEGPLSIFLQPAIGSALETKLGISLGEIYAVKSEAWMTPADSLSFDAFGQPVVLEPFWSILELYLPAGTNDYAALATLRQQGLSIVKAAQFNWAGIYPFNGTAGSPPFLLAAGASQPLAYPLPAHDVVTFALPHPLPATAELTILTQTGRAVRTETHQVYQRGELTPLQFNIETLPAGQYFYRLTTLNTTYCGRLEKN